MPHHVWVNQSCPKLDLSSPYPSASIMLQELSPDKNCNVASDSLKMDERWCFVNCVFLLKQIPDSGISPLRAALHISKKCCFSSNCTHDAVTTTKLSSHPFELSTIAFAELHFPHWLKNVFENYFCSNWYPDKVLQSPVGCLVSLSLE